MRHFRSRDRHFARTPTGWRLIVRTASALAKELSRGRKRLYASALAFKTVLALVPALAILMSVLSADAFTAPREQLLDQIVNVIYPVDTDASGDPTEQQDIQRMNQMGKEQIHRSLHHFAAHAAKVGLLGLAAFFVVLLLLMRDVEKSFNILWGAAENRPLFPQALRHGLFLLAAPLAALLGVVLKQWAMGPGAPDWFFSTFLPYVMLGLFLTGLYTFVPNAKVDPARAALSGFGAALLLETGRRFLTWYAVNGVTHSRIYGALWVFPIILMWFYLSWFLILLGAEVTYILQRQDRPRERT